MRYGCWKLLGGLWLTLVACGSDGGNASNPGEAFTNPPPAGGMQSMTPESMAASTATSDPALEPAPSPAGTEMGPTPVLQLPAPALPAAPNPAPRDCNVPPAPSALSGWASEGMGTTGGGDTPPLVVTSAQDFRTAIQGTQPRVLYLRGSIDGSFNIGSNKTVVGLCDAEIHGHIGFSSVSNSILRNLTVVGRNCSDSPGDCSAGDDGITLTASDHIWIDHLHVTDGSDGNLDITGGSDFVTVSWTKFDYSTRRTDPLEGTSGHRYSNLIGSSDTDARDPGHLNVTYHHIWWGDNVDQRMPRSRRGQIHVFNSLYTAAGNSYCTDAGFEAKLLVQNNVYVGVNRPLEVRDGGNMRAVGNLFSNTTGDVTPTGAGFAPPYSFNLDATAGLEAALRAGVGPQ